MFFSYPSPWRGWDRSERMERSERMGVWERSLTSKICLTPLLRRGWERSEEDGSI